MGARKSMGEFGSTYALLATSFRLSLRMQNPSSLKFISVLNALLQMLGKLDPYKSASNKTTDLVRDKFFAREKAMLDLPTPPFALYIEMFLLFN